MSKPTALPPDLHTWLSTYLPSPISIASRPTTTERGNVLELIDAAGRRACLKHSSSPDRFENERRALVDWAPLARGLRVPEVIAFDRDERVFLLEWIDGEPSPSDADACELAGRALRALHDAPIDAPPDDVSLRDAIGARLDRALVGLAEVLPVTERASWREFAQGVLENLTFERRPCHRDFAPRNWIATDDGIVLVDLEHARFDAPELEHARVWRDLLRDAPELEVAFERGYGTPLFRGDPAVRRLSVGLELLSGAAWFRNRGDDDSVRAFLQILRERA